MSFLGTIPEALKSRAVKTIPGARYSAVRVTMSLLVVGVAVAGALAAQPTELAVKRGERLLVDAPHPDDEAPGPRGLFLRRTARRGPKRVALVTAGGGGGHCDHERQQPSRA